MPLRLDLVVDHEGCPTQRFRDGVIMLQVSGERGAHNTYLMHAPSRAALDRALAIAEEGVQNKADVLHRGETSVLLRGRNLPQGVVSTINASRCSILYPIVYRDGLEFYTLIAPDREASSELVAALAPFGNVKVESVRAVTEAELEAMLPMAGLLSDLTPRQLDVLRLAVAGGYYDLPRRVELTELADRLEMGRSTLSEHLRKAEGALVKRVVHLVEQYPMLAESALKRRGRPPAS